MLTPGECGVREISGRVLSQELFVEMSVFADDIRRHSRWPRLLEDAVLHLRPGRTQLLRDVHYCNDHHQQPCTGLQFHINSISSAFN